jgi:penicillin-binding protein 1B
MRRILLIALPLPVLALAWLVWLDRTLELRFERARTALPSAVFARPVAIEPGMDPRASGLLEAMDRLGYRKTDGEPAIGEYSQERGALLIGRRPSTSGPPERLRLELDLRGRVHALRDSSGALLERTWLDPERVAEIQGAYRSRREPVRLAELPDGLIDAVVHTEDQHFFAHSGLDLWRIGGAAWANLRAGRIVQGGSTITQQLVKNLFLTPERTLLRKVRESLLATLVELHHTKAEILEAYLNEIYLGQTGSVAIHGVGAAARHYFGKRAAELTLAESALLAGIISSPGSYSPFRSPEAALARRDAVLQGLLDDGWIDPTARDSAREEPLRLDRRRPDPTLAPHFAQWLVDQLPEDLDLETLESAGYRVLSTLDPDLQRAAARAVDRGLERLEREVTALAKAEVPLEAALLALDPRSGDVLAMVGGRDFARSQFNRATQARRQPGSVFKPIVALAALERNGGGGPAYTLISRIEDEAVQVDTPEGVWAPVNIDGEFHGEVTLREALEHSYNVPFARIGLALGPERIAEAAARLGITSALQPVPSLALGSSEVTLLEIVRAYATFAAGGLRPDPRGFERVLDAHGVEQAAAPSLTVPVLAPGEAYLVTSALEGAVERGTARALRALGIESPLAGKTGTSNDFRDGWFIGYTPELIAGVWVGFDDGRTLRLPASRTALPIFADFAHVALERRGFRSFSAPDDVEILPVDASGTRAGVDCLGDPEVFLIGTAPSESCVAPWRATVRPFRWLLERLERAARDAAGRGR